MLDWWPEYPSPTRRQRWQIRWYRLRWKAFLPWVRIPIPLDTPKTVTFPLIENLKPEISLIDAVRVQPMSMSPDED